MSRKDKLLASMRENQHDWTVADVERMCRAHGISCEAPKRGSHYRLSHAQIEGKLTVPSRKPIKPVYILLLLEMIDQLD